MFLTLLIVTFIIAVAASAFVVRLFDQPIASIMRRIIAEDLSAAWHRYITFAMFVAGISGGVRIWELERYITPSVAPKGERGEILALNSDRWVLEVYRTVIGTFQSIVWMLLVVFVFALLAFVVVRGFEIRQGRLPSASKE
jgi:hypothetical protein